MKVVQVVTEHYTSVRTCHREESHREEAHREEAHRMISWERPFVHTRHVIWVILEIVSIL